MHWVNNCVFWKNSIYSFTRLGLGEGRSQPLKPGYHPFRSSKRSSKIFVWLEYTQGIVSYGRLFTWRRSGRSRSMFLHGFRLCLWWCRTVEGITYPVIHSSVHGKHNGTKFESLPHSICKLHPFKVAPIVYFPYAYCTNRSFCCCYFVGL